MSNDAYFVIGTMLFAGIMIRLTGYENKDLETMKRVSPGQNKLTNIILFVVIISMFWFWGQS